MRKKVLGIVLIIIGIVSLVFSGNCNAIGLKHWDEINPSKEWYGGDAYTGIQHAAVDTARAVGDATENVRHLDLTIQQVSTYVFVIIGLVVMVIGGNILWDSIERDKKRPKVFAEINSSSEI